MSKTVFFMGDRASTLIYSMKSKICNDSEA